MGGVGGGREGGIYFYQGITNLANSVYIILQN